MGDMQGGIVAGWHDGIGKRVGAWTTATFGWLCVFHDWVSHPTSCPALGATRESSLPLP
jgi:hypothetical protein